MVKPSAMDAALGCTWHAFKVTTHRLVFLCEYHVLSPSLSNMSNPMDQSFDGWVPEQYFQHFRDVIIPVNSSNSSYFCVPCKDTFNYRWPSEIKKHLKGSGHSKNLAAQAHGTTSRYAAILDANPEHFILVDGHLFCKSCKSTFDSATPNVAVHLASKFHKTGAAISKQHQAMANIDHHQFNSELCEAFVAANIPLEKLQNEILKKFLEKRTGHQTLHSSTMRKSYLPKLSHQYRAEIIEYLQSKKIFVSIDETTDKVNRQVAVVMVGSLEINKPGKVFLLDVVTLEAANWATISGAIRNAIDSIFPESNPDAVLFFVTDSASNMNKAFYDCLAKEYPKMTHITCLAHGVHRLSLKILSEFPLAKKVIMDVKALFHLSPKRRAQWRELFPHLPLPPAPVEVRWGSLLTAASYYLVNFYAVKSFVDQLNPKDAAVIGAAQKSLTDEAYQQLKIIAEQFSFLPELLIKLQTRHLPFDDALETVQEVTRRLERMDRPEMPVIRKKWAEILERNDGLKVAQEIQRWMKGEISNLTELKERADRELREKKAKSARTKKAKAEAANAEAIIPALTADDIKYLKYAPLVSVDAERAFSRFSILFSALRRSMKIENVEAHMIIQWNCKGK